MTTSSWTLAALLTLTAAVALTDPASAGSISCQPQFKALGATFDLRPLVKAAEDHYTVKDEQDESQRRFRYVFDVCEDMEAFPQTNPAGQCDGTSPAVGPVYQIYNNTAGHEQCYYLGSLEQAEWGLIDEEDAGRGVYLLYRNGSRAGCNGKDRRFRINFACSDKSLDELEAVVLEPRTCEYEVTFETVYGCPTECHSNTHSMCAGHGLCNYDVDAGTTHCFCDLGYQGRACEVAGVDSDSASPTTVLVIIIIVLLVLLLAAAAILYNKIRSMRVEDNPYGQLDSGDGVPLRNAADDGEA
eukprot:TRINITY_DN66285_c2_g1_i2.p1 TRINITY_DN66285_c2_g1~~TRINITY_DN66285_c2_g1_i2.p1  ORF type:complete len:314 (-),score=118.61 TRINITY_DN66285_c2_g1_i2:143-1042(-)